VRLQRIEPRISAAVERLDLHRPRIGAERPLRILKYRDPARVAPVVQSAADRMASLAEILIEPRGWLRRVPVRSVECSGRVRLDHGIEFRSRALARLLGGACEAVLTILTIGPALEQRARDLFGDDQFMDGLLLDAAGRVAIDALLAHARARLGTEARARGCRLTARLAPGFADWPLDQQRVLCDALREGDLSVTLTDACMMVPRQSASGVYGLTPA
jgi:hypothetical protein